MDKAKDVASKVNSSSKQVKHKSAKNKGASSLKNVSSQNANNASGRIGVAAVALASTLSMLLPGATALAKTPLNADSFDSSYVKSAAKTSGKGAGKGNGNGLYKNGLFNTGATSELAKRQMVSSVKELVKHADSNVDSNASAEGVDNQEAAAGDSSVGVKDSGERSVAGSEAASETGNGDIDGTVDESNNNSNDVRAESSNKRIKTTTEVQSETKSAQNNQKVAKPDSKAAKKEQSAEAKPVETTASKTESTKSEPKNAAPAKTEVVNPATESKTEPANSEPAAKTDSETKTNSDAKTEPDQKSAQPASTENEQPENAQNAQPASEQSASTESAQPAAKAKNDSTTPRVRKRRDTNQNAEDSNKVSSVTPADAGSSADAGNTTNPSTEKPSAKKQVAEGSANGAVTDRSGEGANGSNNNSNANSQVIKPNEQNPTAKTTEQANEQVQTDKKPKATYNLQIRYTIGGAANKQLVQPYELTIDKAGFDNLGKDGKYEYIELPKSAGYRPSVYHSGTYQYYIKNDKNEFVIDDGTNADAVRYLRLDKNLIKEYAVKKRQVVGGNNGAQAPQASSSQTTTNPQSSSSTQMPAEDGIQYYGELNINYAPKTAKYYVRHLVQDLDHKDEFHDAPNLDIGKVITVKHKDGSTENIHVTEITGTVGSDVTAVSTYIPGYEPEHNLISSPLSDSEDESDKLVLNLRYYRKAYEVTYDSAGGTDVTAQKVYYQQDVPQVTKPTRRGYTFKGWSLVDPSKESDPLYDENTIVSLDDYKMPDHNVQFRANWEANNTTSYRVNVWVQKADLVDKEHPNSLANYDFVGLVERKNVKTDSEVALNKMDDAGVIKDANALNGTSADDYVSAPELGLTKEELQGKDSDHKTGLISKFNWMNDTPVTNLDGYNTEDPGAATNNGKDIFTRYFHVNKDLTKKLNSAEYDLVPDRPDLGKRSKSQLCANDLNNTLNLVYDRNTYELIFAKPAGIKNDSLNNAAIKRKDENGKTTIYCYAGGGNCSDEYDDKNEDDSSNAINHKGYRVNVRYGQRLTDIWPDVNELDFNKENTGSLGWTLGYAGDDRRCYRDTPPYRFTKKEFADPSLRVDLKNGAGIAPRISNDPDNAPNNTYELKDNQRLLTADTSSKSTPIQVIIRKQSIASAKNGGDDIDDNDYELSTDSYSKDDTSNDSYKYTAPSIAGFNPADGYDKKNVGDSLDSFEFEDNREEWYNESHGHGNWDDLSDDEKNAFAKKYHLAFRKYRGVPVDEQEDYSGDATEFETNKLLEFRYNRKSYDVQFYNADGKAITTNGSAATESLPFEYSLTKRGKKDLTGEDKELYGNDKSYDASVTKDDAGNTSKQFDGKYTFTLNGKTYSIVRPADLPEDYVFKGWAVDQAGTQFINGENKDITVPVNGIKLYAAWGLPTDIQHTVTFDYHMPKTDDNGNEISGSDVVTEKKFPRYHVIDEKKISTPTRKGYDFYGWEIKKNGTTLPYAFGNKVVEDIKLDAVWVKDTRYNGTFKHIFLKPGVTFADYKNAIDDTAKAAMVDHVSTQTVSGLREHLRYNAEAVYSDETHFPDKHFTSFEASSDESQNTGEFIYQTYNTRKYKVKYIDQNGKELLPESEVSSVNRKYDVAFYKPIEGFMPENTQQDIIYTTDSEGKQTKEYKVTFKYKDVRVLKRNDDKQARPDYYTRYVFKVADNQSSMGSVVDWQNKDVADDSALVYDAIKGTKAYQMPLPTVKAKQGYEFDGWTSQIGSYDAGSTKLQYADGVSRLPIRSEEQNSPEVIYTAKFKLKAPVAAAPQVLKPTENISIANSDDAKKLITNAGDYPDGAKFSFADGEKFDNTPGLHKIKVQVHLGNNTAETEVLYRVLPDLVYASEWDKFKTSDYGKSHVENNEYVKVTFTGDLQQGRILGHDGETSANSPSLVAYVYKGKKDISVRVPQAFGKEYEDDHYHYVFKGWTTGTETDPANITNYDIKSEDRYKTDTFSKDVTYTAVYKRIDYFSSSSDNGTVPEDSVVAIFKPAPGRKWKDGTDGPKVFYVKKGTDLSHIPYSASDQTSALTRLQENLTNAKGTWNRSSMINGKEEVTPIDDVSNWKVDKPFQEFVADQTPWTEPAVQTDYLVAVQDKPDTLPKLTDFITNMSQLKADAAVNNGIEDIKVEYDLPTEAEQNKLKQKMLKKPALYTVPLKVTVKYKDAADYKTYRLVGRLKVLYQLMYPDSLPKEDTKHPEAQTGVNAERNKVLDPKYYVQVKFENAQNDSESPNGKGEFAQGSRKLYYAYKQSASGVRAPQVIGKDYDANGYHYEFQGWEMRENAASVANSANTPNATDGTNAAAPVVPVVTLFASAAPTPTTVSNPPKIKLYSSAEIAGMKFDKNTTFTAVYNKTPNVIDASKQDEIPDGYVATIFMPGFGRTWADGSHKPKLLYIRHGKDKEDNIKFAQKVASDTAAELSGFTKWQMFDAKGVKSNILLHDNWDISKPRIFVAEQNGVDDVKIPETVIAVGEGIPNANKLVHNTDPRVSVSIDDSSTVDVSKPGISTIMVNVTKPTDEIDKTTGKQKTVTTKLPVRVYVLPNVIADNDLPAKGTAEAKFIEKNYRKVTYVAGSGGEMKSPVFTYWVRKGAKDLHMPVPDVLAANGYVFKDWTSITSETPAAPVDKRKATEEEREALYRMAIMYGMPYAAKLISDSHNSTPAALQNLLNEARKQHAEQIYNAKREELAQIAESEGNNNLASEIRQSHDSLQEINDKLVQNGIDVDKIIEQVNEKALLAKIAKEAVKPWLAKQISNSKHSSIESLKNLMQEAGIDLTFANYEETNKSDVSDEQREVLAELADEADKPFVAKIIRSSKKSSLEALKQVLRNAGVNPEISMPEPQPTRETTITANFELMKPMRFEFRSSAVSGIPATFTLTNLTENSSGNATVKVDNTDFTINNFIPDGIGSNGLLPSCNGTTCKISGTPKIVDGKPKVEVKFTTVDQYGRRAEIVVYIDIVDSAKPEPTPEPDYSTVPSDYVVPAYEPAPAPVPVVPLQDKQKTGVKGDLLPQTGVDASQSALIASLLASVGFASFAAKHRRKREDGKNN
ncbi:InlB B-repeat-containing protein [Gardnerella pickettii]|uniref:InlB B-repeat-containing protein n=1 Tax=Gardnerella pickettii TaxID=2914924 RepID=UPI0023DD25FE|nr:InlB B-repeat-containing protein [Gardnerella pickettii]MDF2277903.1 InlB B-repeat-containing protein [Gardnerella pickettii]